MSLYGDLPQAKDEEAASKGWASSGKKLQPTFRPKQAGGTGSSSLLAVPPSLRAGGAGRTGGRTGSSDGGRGGGRGPPPVVHVSASAAGSFAAGPGPVMPGAQHASAQHSSFSFLKALNGEHLKDEYDPSKPNDFEVIMQQREKRKKEAEEEAERAARLREAEQVSLCSRSTLLCRLTGKLLLQRACICGALMPVLQKQQAMVAGALAMACQPGYCAWCGYERMHAAAAFQYKNNPANGSATWQINMLLLCAD